VPSRIATPSRTAAKRGAGKLAPAFQSQPAKHVFTVIQHLEEHAGTPRAVVNDGAVRSATFLVDIIRLANRDAAHLKTRCLTSALIVANPWREARGPVEAPPFPRHPSHAISPVVGAGSSSRSPLSAARSRKVRRVQTDIH